MPKVSVIVPVYNVEQYLEKCIDSICTQTLQDIEIICVDDGSTDSSPQILDIYAKKDSRIRVIHKGNAGYGAAMNTGMDAAKGEYIGIVESDDCILPQMYARLYETAKADDLDLVKADAYYWLERYGYKSRIHISANNAYYDRVLDERDRLVFFQFYMNTWTGIYKRSFLEKYQIRHHETPGASYQDNGFWIQTLYYCRQAKWLNEAYYLYRQDNPTASVKSKSKMYAMRDEYQWMQELFEERNEKQALPIVVYYRFRRHSGTFLRIADELRREFCDTIIEDYQQYGKCLDTDEPLRSWMQNIIEHTDEICRQYNEKRLQVLRQLDSKEKIIIYGTGQIAEWLFRLLYHMGYTDKLSCFVQTCLPIDRTKWTIPVYAIDEVSPELDQAQVIVAVSEQRDAYPQICNELQRHGVDSWMKVSDIAGYFYMV